MDVKISGTPRSFLLFGEGGKASALTQMDLWYDSEEEAGIFAVAERLLKVAVGFNPRIGIHLILASRSDALRFHASLRDTGFLS